jgi:8-oxo-dGTP pyrophosphatase MutT (NUDIX family)
MKEVHCAGGVIRNKLKEIAVVSQQGKSWSFPKGHVDPGEDFLSAAKREILEETGIKDLKLIKEFEIYGRYKVGLDGKDDKSEFKHIHLFLFDCDLGHVELKPQDPDNPEAVWVHKDKVESLLSFPKDRDFFKTVVLPALS